jgi:site-specific DNA-methyltransferase (adenine-specific)
MITFARIAIMIEDKAMFKRQNWVTQRNSRGIGHAKNYMSSREDFLFLTKSDAYTFHAPYTAERTNRKDCGKNGKPRKSPFKRVSNVWIDIAEASQSSLERCFHPTVKAQKLCDRIITTHSNVNDLLFIPFSGAGSEIISALRHERKAIGCEINHLYFDESVKRITKWTKRSAHATFKSQWPAYCF